MIGRFALSRVPGIAWVIALAVALFGASMYALGASKGSAARERALTRAKLSEARAVDAVMEGRVLRKQAVRERALAADERRRADSLAAIALIARGEVGALVTRAAASRARVDTAGLPLSLLEALADADDLRLAVTPALVRDSLAIAGYQATIGRLESTIALKDAAHRADSVGLAARAEQVAALSELVPSRCGRTCGAVIGASAVLLAPKAPALVRQLLNAFKGRG